ncbi:unnamed protein product [Bursaphelenchus xylophilus]|uniref:(pine wood nematode) hypothetical protein n=1 Tax=Bursaphelenchus xylophilus TaxID=6326 RepID=A0A1I7RXV2_BURXY|nr:unnamed protein product [Bursaphelenchus xylophilus]CAG9125187.1 unnamed protein product [Bursaphelenchus xylophilus]
MFALFTIANAADYNETLARVMLTLAAAAYGDDPSQCLRNRFGNAELIDRHEVLCDVSNNNTCVAYIAVVHAGEAIALVFRGSVGDSQLVLQAIAAVTVQVEFQNPLTTVNQYYDHAFQILIKSGIVDQVAQLHAQYPGYRLWITGHSLGAGLASLGALAFSLNGTWSESNLESYTFGKPRIGNPLYAALHTNVVPQHYRVVHAHDTISNIYPQIFGYLHEQHWIWYDNDMSPGSTYIACIDEFDLRCAGYQLLDSDLWDAHRHYFNVQVSDYGIAGCPMAIF